MVRLLFLGLRSLLGASDAVLFLLSGVRLYLFLRRMLLRGFWRFIPHGPKNKIHPNRRQPTEAIYSFLLTTAISFLNRTLDIAIADLFAPGSRPQQVISRLANKPCIALTILP